MGARRPVPLSHRDEGMIRTGRVESVARAIERRRAERVRADGSKVREAMLLPDRPPPRPPLKGKVVHLAIATVENPGA
ncbi:hypothetical protein jaqu_40560 [Jannaschia aquimarina]|uniref:Uncharacterized protein n=1 Tax=Jannaschia aquimarina TaxID=935700 RepID=A0A0D1CHV6_9RHOB|nr:hypothetical protein jaqu_40560 [Jannaschia aquimarina]